jgi:hypothetical protein
MNHFENARDRRERELFAAVEAKIRAASEHVRVSEDLRAETLSAARRAHRNQHWTRRFGTMAACFLVIGACGFVLNYEAGPSSAISSEHNQSLDYTASKGIGGAFSEWIRSLFGEAD